MKSLFDRIIISRKAGHGKLVICELRPPGKSVLEYLVAAGDSFEASPGVFPDLEPEDLQARLEFVARSPTVKSQHLVLA